MFALLLGIGSILVAGQLVSLPMLKVPGSDGGAAAFACLFPIAGLPLLGALILWKQPRLGFLVSLYCFGLAAMSSFYVAALAAPHMIPELGKMLSADNQRFIAQTELRLLPPIAIIVVLIAAGVGAWIFDRRESKN